MDIKTSVKPKLIAAVLAASLTVSAPITTTYAANPIAATEITQLANNAELVALLGKEAQQLAELIKTYELMVQQAKMLPDFIKQNAVNALMDLARSTQAGMAISYASAQIEQDLKNNYLDFDDYEQFLKTATSTQKTAQYQAVLRTTMDTVEGALKSAGLQSEMFQDESVAVEMIMEQMQTAQGQNQILQAAGSIAAAQIAQTQKLRQLVMGQTNVIGAGVALQAEEIARERAAREKARKSQWTFDGDAVPKKNPWDKFK